MLDQILSREVAIRVFFFLGIFFFMSIWEVVFFRRGPSISKLVRWPSNLGIVFLNSFLVKIVFPVTALGFAIQVKGHNWGVLNNWDIPFALKVIIAIVILDFVIYLQHVMFHAVPLLWKLHRMHHTDLDIDVTTGLRFHPLEIILSMIIKMGAIMLIGAPWISVLVFEIVLNSCAMFNHGNVYIPPALDRIIRRFLVTPDMHRVHHSVRVSETNSNYGFSVSWWDRIMGTYPYFR